MRETCSKYKSNNRRIITPYHVSRIFVEDKYRVLYCEVPKAGCSNWKRVLMVLNGLASSTKDIQHNTVHYGNYLKRLDGFDHKGIYHRLNTYTKMLFIREPFEKLVSAFRDKFEHPNNYYHPVFGKAIISRYRVNATKEALRTGSDISILNSCTCSKLFSGVNMPSTCYLYSSSRCLSTAVVHLSDFLPVESQTK